MKSFIKTILPLVILAFAHSLSLAQEAKPQEVPKTVEKIAKDTDILVFIKDKAIADKLSDEEKEQLKLHLTRLLSSTMAVGYKKGAEDSSNFFMKQFAEFAVAQQKAAVEEQKIIVEHRHTYETPKLSFRQRFGIALQTFGNQMATENAKRINCVSNRIGQFTYTNCY